MSEETKNGATEGQEEAQPVFQMIGQFVRDLSFECAKPAFIGEMPKMDFEMDLGVKVDKVGDNLQEVTLMLKAKAKNKDDDSTVYIAEIQNVGIFHVENVSDDAAHAMLFVEGANLIYPQARHIFIACVTDGSFPPPMLGAIDFRTLYMQRQAETAAAAESEATATN